MVLRVYSEYQLSHSGTSREMAYREDLIVTLTVVENGDPSAGNTPGRLARVLTWLAAHKISAVVLAILAIVAVMITASPSAPAQAESTAPATVAAPTAPVITEDSPQWNCTTMGNGLCGPGNTNGATPGYYRGGRLYADWEHAQWMAYGLQVAAQPQPQAQPSALVQTVSANSSDSSDVPIYPVTVVPGSHPYDATGDPRSESAQQSQRPAAEPQAQPQPVTQAQPQAKPQAQPQAVTQAHPDGSAVTGQGLDSAALTRLLTQAQSARSGQDSAAGGSLSGAQIESLLSQLDPDTLNSLLSVARQACQVLR